MSNNSKESDSNSHRMILLPYWHSYLTFSFHSNFFLNAGSPFSFFLSSVVAAAFVELDELAETTPGLEVDVPSGADTADVLAEGG